MKIFIVTATLSILSLGHIAEAQDGKKIRSTKEMTEQLLSTVAVEDKYTEPTLIFSVADQRIIAKLPILDMNTEAPGVIEERTSIAKSLILVPKAPKVEVKATNENRRIGDK